MSLPALAALAGGSAVANIYGQYQAQQASKDAFNKMQGIRDDAAKLIEQGMDPSKLGALDSSYLDDLLNVIPEGAYYSPEEYQYMEGPTPIDYQYVGDVASQQVQDSPEMRAMQLQALNELKRRAEEGLDAESEADFISAREKAGQVARGREGAIIQNLQARGMSGSGIEAVMRQIASQQSASDLAQLTSQQAAENAKQRALGEEMRLKAAGDIRAQDVDLNATNANILNEFALYNSAQRQKMKNLNTQLKNMAMQKEMDEKRRVSDLNVGTSNEAQLKNMAIEQAKRQSYNQNLAQRGELQNQNVLTRYGADTDYAKSMAGARLGNIPDVKAQGAGEAAYQRGMWGTIGQMPMDIYGMYQTEQLNKRKNPTGGSQGA